MSNDISVITKKRLKEKILKYGIISLMLFSIGAGAKATDYYLKRSDLNKGYSSRVDKVYVAMKNKEYSLANVLLSEYEKQKLLKPIDISELKFKIEKEEKDSKVQELREKVRKALDKQDYPLINIIMSEMEKGDLFQSAEVKEIKLKIQRDEKSSKLYKLIECYDFKNASKLLSELKASGIYSQNQIQEFEEEIEGIKPEGVQRLWITKLRDLTIKLRNDERIGVITDTTKKFNDAVEKYGSKTDISRIIPEKDLLQGIESYVKQKKDFPYTDDINAEPESSLKIGSKVKISSISDMWKGEYIEERTRNFPTGSIGQIIDTYKEDWIVEFDKNKPYSWKQEWDAADYWKLKGHKGIARFETNELKILRRVEPSEIKELEEEFERLKRDYQKFLSIQK